jgi:hypothetical protein
MAFSVLALLQALAERFGYEWEDDPEQPGHERLRIPDSYVAGGSFVGCYLVRPTHLPPHPR